MGVELGSQMLQKVTGLTLADLSHICKALAAENGQIVLRIAVDCSNIVFDFAKSTSVTSAVAKHMMTFVSAGNICSPCV
jgi:hypothetical protein